jgi:DNA-binding NarL/FixJ family response regulator
MVVVRRREPVEAPARQATVLVAVGSAQVREAVAALIGAFDGFRVIGEAATHEQAIAIARLAHPRVALVDEELPGSQLGSAIQVLHDQGLAEAIVAIGTRADGANRAQAAGASAYLQMGASPKDILGLLSSALL